MTALHEQHDDYKSITHDTTVDGGWSGQLRVVVATSNSSEPLIFVDSDVLGNRRPVLTSRQALNVAGALIAAAGSMSAGKSTL